MIQNWTTKIQRNRPNEQTIITRSSSSLCYKLIQLEVNFEHILSRGEGQWMARSEFVWMQQECNNGAWLLSNLIWAGHAAKAIWSERLSEAQICVSFVWVSSAEPRSMGESGPSCRECVESLQFSCLDFCKCTCLPSYKLEIQAIYWNVYIMMYLFVMSRFLRFIKGDKLITQFMFLNS